MKSYLEKNIITKNNLIKEIILVITLIALSLLTYQYNIVFYNILFLIPIYILEKKGLTNDLIKLIYSIISLATITLIYNMDYYSTYLINKIIVWWTVLVIIFYMQNKLVASLKEKNLKNLYMIRQFILQFLTKINIFRYLVPNKFFSYKTIFIIFILGLIFIYNVIPEHYLYFSYSPRVLTINLSQYTSFFTSIIINNGLITLFLICAITKDKIIKYSCIYLSSIFVLSFIFAYTIIYIGYSGLGGFVSFFPLNKIFKSMYIIGTNYSIFNTTIYAAWLLILLPIFKNTFPFIQNQILQKFIIIIVICAIIASTFAPQYCESISSLYPINRLNFH